MGKRALVVRSGALGDTLVAFPALAALAEAGYHVELVGRPPAHALAVRPGIARRAHSIDRMPGRALFVDAHPEALAFVRRFSLVVLWSRVPPLERMAREAGIPVIDGPYRPVAGEHVSRSLLESLAPLGVAAELAPAGVSLRPPPGAIDGALGELGLAAGGYVAIHPSSGSPAKNWPAERFLELARLAVDAGLRVVWLQGEADEAVVAPLADLVPGTVLREASLSRLCAVISGAALYVGNDSGVSHLAAATGAPTVAVFRSSDPVVWGMRGPRVTLVPATHSARHLWEIAHASFEAG